MEWDLNPKITPGGSATILRVAARSARKETYEISTQIEKVWKAGLFSTKDYEYLSDRVFYLETELEQLQMEMNEKIRRVPERT